MHENAPLTWPWWAVGDANLATLATYNSQSGLPDWLRFSTPIWQPIFHSQIGSISHPNLATLAAYISQPGLPDWVRFPTQSGNLYFTTRVARLGTAAARVARLGWEIWPNLATLPVKYRLCISTVLRASCTPGTYLGRVYETLYYLGNNACYVHGSICALLIISI